MTSRVPFIALVAVAATALSARAHAQDAIKIGELNSYKSQPAFLEPYKRGIELAVDEINKSGGVLGKKIEVISRDDGADARRCQALRKEEERRVGEESRSRWSPYN